jgi:hypothetical protein
VKANKKKVKKKKAIIKPQAPPPVTHGGGPASLKTDEQLVERLVLANMLGEDLFYAPRHPRS